MIDIGKVKEIFNKPQGPRPLGRNSFIIVTDDENYHERFSQPCYGELRKYESTHTGQCTQPGNEKPSDLHFPFPDGKPTGLVLHDFNWSSDRDLRKLLFSNESPWKKGFVDEQYVEHHDKFIVLHNPDFDPTVLVNMLKVLVCGITKLPGLDLKQQIAASLASHSNPTTTYPIQYGYHTPVKFSFKRFFNSNPMDLTGGVWGDRIDYNRTRMQDVFFSSNAYCHAKDYKDFTGTQPHGYFPLDQAAKIWSKIIDHSLKNEPDPINEPYFWTTTLGKTNRI